MKRLALVVLLIVLPLAIGAELSPRTIGLPDTGRQEAGGNAVKGKFVMLGGRLGNYRIACAQCHGMDGLAEPGGAVPRLDGQVQWYLYSSLQQFASGERYHPVMTPVALQLDDPAMRDVARYLSRLSTPAVQVPGQDNLALRQLGGAISAAGVPENGVPACQSCHGEAGRGGPPVAPVLAGQYAPYVVAQLQRWKEGRRGGDPLNVMRQIAMQMSDEDIRAVAAYFEAVRREGP